VTFGTLIRGLEAKRSGQSWKARCPAHNDRNPSLSLREDCGTILVRCHAGCTQAAVIAALRERGLWKPDSGRQEKQRRIVAEYDYTNERGELLYQVVRFEPKSFAQRYPDGRGNWIWRKHSRQVLYRLPEVLESPIVFVVEGERDVETLRSHGFVATTNAGGANAPWLASFNKALQHREVILLSDADLPGRKRVLAIARSLIGIAQRILVWEPEGAKDITEWFQKGHSELELIEAITTTEEVRS
jgi:5S rRNA maturation endonuclease (ribonuclease M5)